MPSVASSRTQATYENLRTELIMGYFGPDEHIKPADVAARMNVSLGAVREALSRLSSDCLVIAEPQRGFRAAPMSEDDLSNLLDARKKVENLCLDRAIECGDVAWESRVVAAFHHLRRTPEMGAQEQVSMDWIQAHEEFHQALVSACDNIWLLRTRGFLYTQCERYRSIVVISGDQAGRDLDTEHHAIMEAAISRDADLAGVLLRNHYKKTARDWLGSLRARSGAKEPPSNAQAS